ncbi:hypothetical protein CVT24_002748, partial [Panaeolus cyanescens]
MRTFSVSRNTAISSEDLNTPSTMRPLPTVEPSRNTLLSLSSPILVNQPHVPTHTQYYKLPYQRGEPDVQHEPENQTYLTTSHCGTGKPQHAYFSPYGYGYDLRGKRQYNLNPSDAECARIKSDPRNHCPELLDVLYPPQEISNDNANANNHKRNDDDMLIFLVFPLYRPALSPRFDTIGEIVDFCRQLFEAVEFLHENGVAHRDIHTGNIMYDPSPMFPTPYHPAAPFRTLTGDHVRYHTRTVAPPTYILIDLGHGVHRSGAPPGVPLLTSRFVVPGDKTVPELAYGYDEEEMRIMREGSYEERRALYDRGVDPFMIDVYCVGN